MTPEAFETAVPTSEKPQTHALVTCRFDLTKWRPVKLSVANIITGKSENTTISTTNKYVLGKRGEYSKHENETYPQNIFFTFH